MDADEAQIARGDATEARRWANYFEVGYNAYEVVLHFGQFYAHNGEVQWHTRIVTHPAYAGEFLETLRASLEGYERAFPAGKGGQMPNEVQYKLTLAVKDGPKLDLSDTVKVDAYDKVEFELRSQQSQTVDLQPTDPAPQVHFLVVQSKPDAKADPTDTKTVWYTVDGGASPIALASSHALVGKGVINLLAKTPKTLTFTNKRDTTVTITCLVGRDNKPEPPAGGGPGGGGGAGYPGGGGGTPYPGGGGGGGEVPPSGGGGTSYPGGGGGGGGTTPYPGGGGGGGTTPYPGGGGGGGTTQYPGGGGGGTTQYPGGGGGGGGTTQYPGGGGGGETPGNPGGQKPTYPSGSENPPQRR